MKKLAASIACAAVLVAAAAAHAQNPSPYVPQPTCPEGWVLQGEHCIAATPPPPVDTTPPPPPPPPPPRRGDVGESCRVNDDCTTSICSNETCVASTPPPPPPVVVEQQSAPVAREAPSIPALDTTRKWMFSDVVTYDPTLLGIGDIFMIDIAVARLGNTNSSLSVGAGVGIIASLANGRDSNFAIPIPITVTGRFGIGTSIEIDAKLGAVPYFYSQNKSTDSWGGKLVLGAALRVPFSTNGGLALLAGFDLYLINGTVPLPEIGMTF